MNRVCFYMQIIWIDMLCQPRNYMNRGCIQSSSSTPPPKIFPSPVVQTQSIVRLGIMYYRLVWFNIDASFLSSDWNKWYSRLSLFYSMYPKYWDKTTAYHTHPKIWTYAVYYLLMCLKTAEWMANSIVSDQTQQKAVFDLGLHCLIRPICPDT